MFRFGNVTKIYPQLKIYYAKKRYKIRYSLKHAHGFQYRCSLLFAFLTLFTLLELSPKVTIECHVYVWESLVRFHRVTGRSVHTRPQYAVNCVPDSVTGVKESGKRTGDAFGTTLQMAVL